MKLFKFLRIVFRAYKELDCRDGLCHRVYFSFNKADYGYYERWYNNKYGTKYHLQFIHGPRNNAGLMRRKKALRVFIWDHIVTGKYKELV